MNREQAESLLAQLVFDDFEEPVRSQLLEYLKTDPELNERLGDMRLTAKLLHDAVAADGTRGLDDTHKAELHRQIDQDQRKRSVLTFLGKPIFGSSNGLRLAELAAVIAICALLVGILLPSLGSARKTAIHAVATSRARETGVGLYAYAQDNEGRYPERVSQLVEGGYLSAEALIAPDSDVSVPENLDKFTPGAQSRWIDKNSSFQLLAKGKKADEVGPDQIVGYMKLSNDKGVSIARGDGSAFYESDEKTPVLVDAIERNKPALDPNSVRTGDIISRSETVAAVTPADEMSLTQARIDAARHRLALKDSESDFAAAAGGTAGTGVVTEGIESSDRFAGRGYASYGNTPAEQSDELYLLKDQVASSSGTTTEFFGLDDAGRPVELQQQIAQGGTNQNWRLYAQIGQAGDAMDQPSGGVMGGYGGYAAGEAERPGAIALNESSSESTRGDSLDFYYGRQAGSARDGVATAGALVLGDEPLSSTLSTATPATPAATPVQTPYLLQGGTSAPVPAPRETPSNEAAPDANRPNSQWYAMSEDKLADDVRALGAAGVEATEAERNRRLTELRRSREVSLHMLQERENKEEYRKGIKRIPTDKIDESTAELLALGETIGKPAASEEQSNVEGKTDVGYRIVPTEDPAPARKPRLMPVNPWVMTAEDQLSTFALDVDTASYDIARRYINDGFLPPKHTVRMEEFVNNFDYNYPTGQDDSEAFTVQAEAGESPFGGGTVLLKVGVRGKVVGRDQAKPANLVFVVDTSGSMDRDDRLPLVRQSLGMVLDQLSPQDRVSVVSYGTEARLLIEAAPANEKMRILDALESLQTGGATNLISGVELGYQVAQRQFITNGVNRVILNSDGVANVGPSETQELIDQAQTLRKQGVTFTSVGFGAGDYDDQILEQLANKGDGGYLFVGSLEEARRVFVDNLAATRPTIAFDAKIQVDFDPARVRRYRLIGYENRDIADTDFRNDAVDAGEVGSGQSATALYEIELLGPTYAAGDQPDLGTVYVRYRDPDSGKVREIESRLTNDLIAKRDAESDPRFFLAAGAARFAEVLRGSEYVGDPDVNHSLAKVQSILEPAAAQLPMDAAARELVGLVRRSQGLPRAE